MAALEKATTSLSTDELREVPPEALLPWRKGPDVYVQLRVLERMGICRRVAGPADARCVYWTYTHAETLAAVMQELDQDEERRSGA